MRCPAVKRSDQLIAGTFLLRGLRQRLRVDEFPDVREFPVSNGYREDPMILERLVRRFDRPLGETDDKNSVSVRYELRGRRVGSQSDQRTGTARACLHPHS